ncbi:MAG: extracellular solute-binding protein [Burkholderiaceae bacterium]
MFNRRDLIQASAAVSSLALSQGVWSQAKPEKLTILSHRVHRSVLTGAKGGDATADWSKRTGIAIEWITLDTGPLHERLFREASLSSTSVDLAFLLNTRATPSVSNLLEPLDALMKADALEDPSDMFPGLVAAMKFGGKLYAVPHRHATTGFHYNEAIFKEKGVPIPKTFEDVIEAAKKLTFTRADGTQVFGFLIEGDNYPNVIDMARAYNGDFITGDFKLGVNEPAMLRAVQTMRDFYAAGVIPRNWTAIKGEEVNTWMQTGRVAMTITSFGRTQFYNDKEKSKHPGEIKVMAMPAARDFKARFPDAAPAKTEFWSMCIPKSARNKAIAWSLIKELSSKQNTLMAALNGNGPVRASVYKDANFIAQIPYAAAEAATLKVARVPIPAFDNAAKAGDIFVEELQAAVLGRKGVALAMDDVARRVKPLLP